MTPRSRLVSLVVVVIALLLGIFLWWNSRYPRNSESGTPAQPTTIRVALAPFAANLPFFVLQDRALLNDPSLRLEAVPARDPSESLNLVVAGHADVGASAFSGTFAALAKQPDVVRLFMPIYESRAEPTSYILVPLNSPLRSIQDLKGKRVGTYTGATQLLFLKLVLDQSGVGASNVEIIQVEPNLQLPALTAGQFDALFTVDTYAAVALAQRQAKPLVTGPRTAFIADPFWLGSAFVSKRWADMHPRELNTLVKTLDTAIIWIRENPAAAKQLLPGKTPIPVDVLPALNLPHWVTSNETLDIASVQRLADLLHQHEIIKTPVQVAPYFLQAPR